MTTGHRGHPSRNFDSLFYVTWPDGLAANKLLCTESAHKLDKSIFMQGVCAGHCLQLSANAGVANDDILNGQFSLASTLSLASNVVQVAEGMCAVHKKRVKR